MGERPGGRNRAKADKENKFKQLRLGKMGEVESRNS